MTHVTRISVRKNRCTGCQLRSQITRATIVPTTSNDQGAMQYHTTLT
ncbi:MAG: hypothetical protein PUF62_03840 [Bacteroidales bacterium]|nr:hypothetical protein [Bacteroidales bacterium]